jgi:hypothetical protein
MYIISLCMYFQAFTLNAVPPTEEEIVAGGIGRNFISRDLLEASSIDDALTVRCCSLSLPTDFMVHVDYGRFISWRLACLFREFVHQQKFLWDIIII